MGTEAVVSVTRGVIQTFPDCHLANIGYRLRRPLTWDPVRERFEGDDEANGLLYREPREMWKL